MSMFSAASKGAGPYNKAVKVRVVAAEAEPRQYTGKDGSLKKSLTVCVSDGEKVARLLCYDATQFAKFKLGSTLVLREFIKRTEDGTLVVVITSSSRVFVCAPMEVPAQHSAEGRLILNPPPADFVPISNALSSPLKQRVSIEGKIIQEEQPRKVEVKGDEVTIKTVTVEDVSGKARVTLWREASKNDVRPGDHVKITDVVVNIYNNQASLSTTQRTTVQKSSGPKVTVTKTIEAVAVHDGKAELLTEDGASIVVDAELLMGALSSEGEVLDIETCTEHGPVDFRLTQQGSDVVSIEKL